LSEQFISVGAALQSFLVAVHAAGYGGILLSGKRVATSAIRRAFALGENEQLVGFISMGTPAGEPRPRQRPSPDDHLQIWQGQRSEVQSLPRRAS
jgi:nitroreductase